MAWFKRDAHPEADLSAYLDGELGEAARRRIQAHLEDCRSCSELLEELRAAKSMLTALPQLQPSRSFALGPQYAAERRPEPKRSWLTFAPVAALTVFLALVAVDVAGTGSSMDESAGSLTAMNTAAESGKAGDADTFTAPAADSAAPEAASAPSAGGAASGGGTAPAAADAGTAASTADGEAAQTRQADAAPEAPGEDAAALTLDETSSDGPSLLRILEAGAALALGASLLIVLWPRIRRRGER